METRTVHSIPPVWDGNSRILILGSFPSVRSREAGFFYAHAQNRFWRVLAAVFGAPLPASVEEKKAFLLKNGVALWDVVGSCEIHLSSDSSIRNAKANDFAPIIAASGIERVFVNGNTASSLYDALVYPSLGIKAVKLPSTSPANAAWSFERLLDAWRIIK